MQLTYDIQKEAERFVSKCYPDVPKRQQDDIIKIWWTAHVAMATNWFQIGDPKVSEDEGTAFLESIRKQIDAFIAKTIAEAFPPNGTTNN